jgi:large subunit ribosomal protein L24
MGKTAKRHDAGSFQPHVKKGDEVLVLSGRSVGSRGRVVSVDPQRERAVVEGVNIVTKHQRAPGMARNPQAAARQQSGRIEKPGPVHVSNLMVVCPSCNTPTRVARGTASGTKGRFCKRCHASLERAS